jgi:uncharacterized membrane protein
MKSNTYKQFSDSNDKNSDGWIGILYFNRKDSRLLVPKRFYGLGWTLNFANPFTYVLLIVIVLIILIFNYFIK